MARLNYHHLHYFWAVAKEGNLTRAAEQLHVSQSALSVQIRLLEQQLDQTLFTREGRTLQLTEAGRLALSYAESIFATGNELMAVLREGARRERQILRIGNVATLSRNFQENLIKPLLSQPDIELKLHSGSLDELLAGLSVHQLDLVLSNRRVHGDAEHPWRCRRIAQQPISLIGRPRPADKPFRYPQDLARVPLLLPGYSSDVRSGFDLLCEQLGLRVQVLAEVDDMAMLRLLTRDSGAVALMPAVVVQDELRDDILAEYCVVPHLNESFYAITTPRRFQPPLLKTILQRPSGEILGFVSELSGVAERTSR